MRNLKWILGAGCSVLLTACNPAMLKHNTTYVTNDINYMQTTYPTDQQGYTYLRGITRTQSGWREYSNARIEILQSIAKSMNDSVDHIRKNNDWGFNHFRQEYKRIIDTDFSNRIDEFCIKETNNQYDQCLATYPSVAKSLADAQKKYAKLAAYKNKLASLAELSPTPYVHDVKPVYSKTSDGYKIRLSEMLYTKGDNTFTVDFNLFYNANLSLRLYSVSVAASHKNKDGDSPTTYELYDAFGTKAKAEKIKISHSDGTTTLTSSNDVNPQIGDSKLINLIQSRDHIGIVLHDGEATTKPNVISDFMLGFDAKTFQDDYKRLKNTNFGSTVWKESIKRYFGINVADSVCSADLPILASRHHFKVESIYQIRWCGFFEMYQALPEYSLFRSTHRGQTTPIILNQRNMIQGESFNSQSMYFTYDGPTYFDAVNGARTQAITFSPYQLPKAK